MVRNQVNNNLTLINILSFLSELNFREGILMLFLSQSLSWSEIAVLYSSLIITKAVFEIPTGIFADRHSRKLSLFLAFIIFALGLFVIAISQTFVIALVSFILWGISDAFYSGSQESLLYDTLRDTGEEANFGQKESERMAWFEGGIIFASISGGFLFDIYPSLPFLAMGFVYIVSAGISLLIVEPEKEVSLAQPLARYLSDLTQNIRLLMSGKFLGKSLLYTLLVLSIVVYIVGEFFDETGMILHDLNGVTIGILFSLTSVMSLLANVTYPKWKHAKISLIGIGIFITLVATITGYLQIMIIAMLVRCGLWAMLEIRTKTIINQAVPSGYRTSLLSTFSFLTELPFVLISPIIGVGVDRMGYSKTLAGFVVMAILILISVQNKNNYRRR